MLIIQLKLLSAETVLGNQILLKLYLKYLDTSILFQVPKIIIYQIIYEIDGQEVDIKFEKTILWVNKKVQNSFKNVNLPDHVLIYYSGHNVRVDNFIKNYDDDFSSSITKGDVTDSRRFIG